MLSIQAKIILGIVAAVIVAAGLTIWVILSLGNGPLATLTPLVLSLLVILVSRSAFRGGSHRGSHRGSQAGEDRSKDRGKREPPE